MIERVGLEQVRLVEEEDGVDALLTELLDVSAEREKDGGRGRRRAEAERDAELPIEVALADPPSRDRPQSNLLGLPMPHIRIRGGPAGKPAGLHESPPSESMSAQRPPKGLA
jgi:hypothetical protein